METFRHVSQTWLLLNLCFPIIITGKELFSTNTFAIPPNTDKVVVQRGEATSRDYYTITNFGINQVYAVVQGGWKAKDLEERQVKPGQTIKIPLDQFKAKYLRLKIKNTGENGAVVFASVNNEYKDKRNRDGGSNFLSVNTMELLQSVTTFGVDYIPIASKNINAFVDYFWPTDSPNVWDQVSEKLENMVDESFIKLYSDKLSREIGRIRNKIRVFSFNIRSLKQNEYGYLTKHFVNLVEDMFGLEEIFVLDSYTNKYIKFNYYLLPYFCKAVSLQMDLYDFGIAHHKELKLDKDAVRSLRMYQNAVVFTPDYGARDYLQDVYQKYTEYVFTDCQDGEEIYNCMSNARSYLILNGLQYIDVWGQSLQSKLMGFKPLICNPLFSTYFGRPSHAINELGSTLYEPDELMPGYWDGHCNGLTMVDVFLCDGVLCGLKTYFEDDTEHVMGNENREYTRIDFRKRPLKRLNVYGSDAIEGLEFYFDEEEQPIVGRRTNLLGTFAVDGHFISGILVTNGVQTINPKALANIAVSYIQDGY